MCSNSCVRICVLREPNLRCLLPEVSLQSRSQPVRAAAVPLLVAWGSRRSTTRASMLTCGRWRCDPGERQWAGWPSVSVTQGVWRQDRDVFVGHLQWCVSSGQPVINAEDRVKPTLGESSCLAARFHVSSLLGSHVSTSPVRGTITHLRQEDVVLFHQTSHQAWKCAWHLILKMLEVGLSDVRRGGLRGNACPCLQTAYPGSGTLGAGLIPWWDGPLKLGWTDDWPSVGWKW